MIRVGESDWAPVEAEHQVYAIEDCREGFNNLLMVLKKHKDKLPLEDIAAVDETVSSVKKFFQHTSVGYASLINMTMIEMNAESMAKTHRLDMTAGKDLIALLFQNGFLDIKGVFRETEEAIFNSVFRDHLRIEIHNEIKKHLDQAIKKAMECGVLKNNEAQEVDLNI